MRRKGCSYLPDNKGGSLSTCVRLTLIGRTSAALREERKGVVMIKKYITTIPLASLGSNVNGDRLPLSLQKNTILASIMHIKLNE